MKFRVRIVPCLASLLFLSVMCAAPHRCVAEDVNAPAPADRIRIEPMGAPGAWWEGTLVAATADSLWWRGSETNQTFVVEQSKVSRLQAYGPYASSAATGALIGGGLGLGLSAYLVALDQSQEGSDVNVGAVALLVTGVGLAVGALIGSSIKKDGWKDAARPGLSIHGSGESIRLGFGISPAATGRFD